MTNPLVLTFRAPTKPLSQNNAKGKHWARVNQMLDPWKAAAHVTAHNAIVRGEWKATDHRPITVQVAIPFRDVRRRDAHNYTGTIVKAVVDGLVKAGVVPDDTPDWVTVLDPLLEVVGPLPALAIARVIITERTPTP